jgi:hypothetical protein
LKVWRMRLSCDACRDGVTRAAECFTIVDSVGTWELDLCEDHSAELMERLGRREATGASHLASVVPFAVPRKASQSTTKRSHDMRR